MENVQGHKNTQVVLKKEVVWEKPRLVSDICWEDKVWNLTDRAIEKIAPAILWVSGLYLGAQIIAYIILSL